MAINWIHFGGELGPVARSALADAEARINGFRHQTALPAFRDLLVQMRNGDNSDPTHYTEIAARFSTGVQTNGTYDNDAAKKLMDQIESYYGIMTNTSSTLAQVYAAHDQMQAILKNV